MAAVFFVIWLCLFISKKNTRKEMLIMSLIFSIVGPLADILYTQDWWSPSTLTESPIGPESLLVGFMIGGIASVIYEDFFKKKIKIRKVNNKNETKRNLSFLFVNLLLLVIFFGTFYLLNFNSLMATILGLLASTSIIWFKRNDLIIDSIATGILLVIVAMFVYSILSLITPGWISEFWHFKNTPQIIIFNLPLDDLIWYFLAGMYIGPLYEFWQERKIVNDNCKNPNFKRNI